MIVLVTDNRASVGGAFLRTALLLTIEVTKALTKLCSSSKKFDTLLGFIGLS